MHQVGPGCALMERRAALDPGPPVYQPAARSRAPMPLAIFRRYLSFAAAVAVATLAGCGMTKPPISKKQFSQNVAAPTSPRPE